MAAEFTRYGIPSVLCTDDGSYGFAGLVTQALEKYLDRLPVGPSPMIYTCGPEPMMKRVAQIAAAGFGGPCGRRTGNGVWYGYMPKLRHSRQASSGRPSQP